MNSFKRFETNLIDLIGEQQIKLGYMKERVSFYYPLGSLKNILSFEGGIAEAYDVLREFAGTVKDTLGEVSFSNQKDRFCITIPPEGSQYVHEHFDELNFGFLEEFLQTISRHGCTLEDLTEVFKKYADQYGEDNLVIEKMEDEEFDYCFYFKNDKPDDYRYCINFEGHHTTYHRFGEADYKEMFS